MTLPALLFCLATQAHPTTLSGPALLDDLEQRAFNFFWTQTNPTTGLAKDRAGNFASDTYTQASIASTGYSLAADVIGLERGWITYSQAYTRARLTLDFLSSSKAAKAHGWFYHFVDWNTGARIWSSEVSSIDTAIMLSGALMAQQVFKDNVINSDVNSIVNNINWQWMLTNGGANPTSNLFSMGWTPESGFIQTQWNTLSEEAILYVLAYGAWPSMPNSAWGAIARPLITYGNNQEVQGGPLFMHVLSQGFIPEYAKRDSLGWDYSIEELHAMWIQRQYCSNNPNHFKGYSSNLWGLSASDSPNGYEACGAPGWGVDDGTLDPAITIAGVQADYGDCINAANNFRSAYPAAYGNYGFANAINPTKNWIDTDAIGIDLGMEMLGIENWRTGYPSAVWGQNPLVVQGMYICGFHNTSEGSFTSRALVWPNH
jgi:hypothetical protein